ncbi:response regulator [Mariprofundus sp. NF]|uniref:response regulator n=1 Tax=Mariprofundus sp. NF TaxID=2608716 RepID=UPI0015A317FF|nr:response regulator [Mariprofundus sp. NF]NWF39212.1 response regulator [Mariprofundus sp. NF]
MVLIIENNFYLGNALKDLLLEISANSMLYRTAEDAINDLDFLCNHHVTAIVCNHSLPGMSGSEFIKQIKSHLKPCVCILISSTRPADIPHETIFLEKPFVPGMLLKTIKEKTTAVQSD